MHNDRPPTIVKPDPSADELAATVRAELEKVRASLANALASAINAGEALIVARSKLGRGWQKWVREACGIALSTAKLCIQLAQHRAEIEAAIGDSAELSLRGARRLISKPCPRKRGAPKDTLETLWKRATAEARTTFLDRIGVAAILESMSADFGRDLRSRVPAPNSMQNDFKKAKSPTLSLTETTDRSGKTVFT
jgi:hypothetical protein